MSDERGSFEAAIRDDPRDVATRKIFADWLEDHDEPELADLHRSFTVEKYEEAKKVLRSASEDCGVTYREFLERLDRIATGAWDDFIFNDTDMPASVEEPTAVWDAYEIVRGVKVKIDKSESICSCSC